MPELFGLYVILTDPVTGYAACGEAAVRAGVRYLQLRMKESPEAEIVATARVLRKITRGSGTRLIINDDVRIAAEVDADGVHLGQDDMGLPEARRIWGESGKIYGLSTHSLAQARAALAVEPDYIGVGPVFPTPTKKIADPALGLQLVGEMVAAAPLTAVVLGGIDLQKLPAVLAAGAVNFSAVRAIMQSEEPENIIRKMMQIWREFYPG